MNPGRVEDRFEEMVGRMEAGEVYRRMEALASRVGDLSSEVAVLNERNRAMVEELSDIKKETAGLAKIANKGMGVLFVLSLIGGSAGLFWEKLSKYISGPHP